jgi:CheY-like chemotaxis protein
VADDEPGVRNLARTGLERQGYRVLLAADGADAVEVFRREGGRVGLVVLDATMPNMTGREAFDLIRETDPRVPVIFASGFPVGQLLPDPPPARTAFLNKPYTPSQLAAEVRRLLDPAAAPGG